MKTFLEFDDAGAQDDEPAKGVTVGDIRAWHDKYDDMFPKQMAEYFATRLQAEMMACPEHLRYSFVDTALLVKAIEFLREIQGDLLERCSSPVSSKTRGTEA